MDPQIIIVLVVAAIVMTMFGVFRRKKDEGTTRIIIVDGDKHVTTDGNSGGRSRGISPFKQFLLTVVALITGFVVGGYAIMDFIEPEFGYLDPWGMEAVFIYLIISLLVYGMLRLFVR